MRLSVLPPPPPTPMTLIVHGDMPGATGCRFTCRLRASGVSGRGPGLCEGCGSQVGGRKVREDCSTAVGCPAFLSPSRDPIFPIRPRCMRCRGHPLPRGGAREPGHGVRSYAMSAPAPEAPRRRSLARRCRPSEASRCDRPTRDPRHGRRGERSPSTRTPPAARKSSRRAPSILWKRNCGAAASSRLPLTRRHLDNGTINVPGAADISVDDVDGSSYSIPVAFPRPHSAGAASAPATPLCHFGKL